MQTYESRYAEQSAKRIVQIVKTRLNECNISLDKIGNSFEYDLLTHVMINQLAKRYRIISNLIPDVELNVFNAISKRKIKKSHIKGLYLT